MPHGLCHFTVNASDRSEVPASDTSSKMDKKEQFSCSLQVQKLCCLHYNVLLHTPGLEPYPTPLPLSNIKIPLVYRYNFDMPCNMGSGEIMVQHFQEQRGHWIWLQVGAKPPSLRLQLQQLRYTSPLYLLTEQNTISLQTGWGKESAVCRQCWRGEGSQPYRRQNSLTGLLLPRQRQRQYAFSTLHHPLTDF